MTNKEMPPAWGRGLQLKKELKEQKTLASLFFNSKQEIEKKRIQEPLLETPQDVFEKMESNNEIRGEYAPFEFLKVGGNDLVISITDIHGDRDNLQQVLDYVKERKKEMKNDGEIHLVYDGDIAAGVNNEDIECLFDLLTASQNGDFKLHYLKGNVERDAAPATQLRKSLKDRKENFASLPNMTDYFKSLPNALFLQTKDSKNLLFNHSVLPLVNKRKFEKEGLEVYNNDRKKIDKTGLREVSATWAGYDGEQEKGELGGDKIMKIGKESFKIITDRLNLDGIFRGHDSDLIKNKAKDTGVHVESLENGKNVYTFHTSKKATGDFGVLAEIGGDGEIDFKRVDIDGVEDADVGD